MELNEFNSSFTLHVEHFVTKSRGCRIHHLRQSNSQLPEHRQETVSAVNVPTLKLGVQQLSVADKTIARPSCSRLIERQAFNWGAQYHPMASLRCVHATLNVVKSGGLSFAAGNARERGLASSAMIASRQALKADRGLRIGRTRAGPVIVRGVLTESQTLEMGTRAPDFSVRQ